MSEVSKSQDIRFVMTLDTQQAQQANEEVRRESERTTAQILTNIRRVAQVVTGLAIAVFGTANELLAVSIETGILIAEMIAAAAAAESVASLGITIAFQYASFVALLNTIFALKNERRDIAARSRGVNQLFRAVATFR